MELIEAMRRESAEDPRLRTLVGQFEHHNHGDVRRVTAQVAYMLVTGHTVWGTEFDTAPANLDVLASGAERLLECHRAFVVKVEFTSSVLNTQNVAAIDVICVDGEHEPS